MNKIIEDGGTFRISIGLAFVGGYADASSYLLAQTFTGHLTGNCVLAAVSAATKDWHLTLDRLLAVIVFLGGIFVSMIGVGTTCGRPSLRTGLAVFPHPALQLVLAFNKIGVPQRGLALGNADRL